MLTLSALCTYPLKSAGRLEHEAITLTPTGPADDRRWSVVTRSRDGHTVTVSQREAPMLARIAVHAGEAGALILKTPGRPDLRVTRPEGAREPVRVLGRFDTRGVDAGPEAAAWLSAFLGLPARLVYMPEDELRPVSLDYTDQPAQTSFTDGYPLLIVSEASLDALNDRLIARGADPVTMARFRPNLVVSGAAPFEEDTWKHIRIGGVPFEVVKPCARCKITTVDPETGTVPDAAEPTATLASFRRVADGRVMFGQNVIHRGMGVLRVGASVEVVSTQPALAFV